MNHPATGIQASAIAARITGKRRAVTMQIMGSTLVHAKMAIQELYARLNHRVRLAETGVYRIQQLTVVTVRMELLVLITRQVRSS
jgi:hypothetical protein